MVGGMNKGKEGGERGREGAEVGGQRKAFLLRVEFTSPVHRLVVLEEAQIVSPFVSQVAARLLLFERRGWRALGKAAHGCSGGVRSHPSRLSRRGQPSGAQLPLLPQLSSEARRRAELSSQTCETQKRNLKTPQTLR